MGQSIIGVITTKNRPQLLKHAILSAISQIRKLNLLMICSDSDKSTCIIQEKSLAKEYNIHYIYTSQARNCSGVRNCAVLAYINTHLLNIYNYNSTYVAFLDDDDTWDKSYIEKCCSQTCNSPDFVISGIVFQNGNCEQKLTIPQYLDISTFLKGNPHIQGSNIFIKLSTLLKCGLFDENLSSSVDRDLFVRLMLLKPKYAIVKEHLVYVDVNNSRWRISNSIELKKEDLRKFYLKYSGMMSKEIKSEFFERNERLFNINKNDILNSRSKLLFRLKSETRRINIFKKYEGRIVVGIIITNINLGLRLISGLIKLQAKLKIVIIKNYDGNINQLTKVLINSNYEFRIYDHNQTIEKICTTRNILFDNLFSETVEGDIIWILDDDMELSYVSKHGTILHSDVHATILKNFNKYDAVVGDYTMDPPLPTLSILRTKLLDYVYSHKLGYKGGVVIDNMRDYYYDLSERTGEHLETPFPVINYDTGLEEIFSGKATSRPLTFDVHEDRLATNCGGNILIFNRQLLKIRHKSISIANNAGRRSDYFWVLECMRNGFKIANVAFATLHNRKISTFKYDQECNKLLRDIIGSSCTKTIEKIGFTLDYSLLTTSFINIINRRLTMYVASYFRVIGLLQILEDNKYKDLFTELSLVNFVNKIQNIICNNNLNKEWETLIKRLN